MRLLLWTGVVLVTGAELVLLLFVFGFLFDDPNASVDLVLLSVAGVLAALTVSAAVCSWTSKRLVARGRSGAAGGVLGLPFVALLVITWRLF